ncbi:hypothetical protein JOF53_000937 [Crossiella equi]|uniref:Uncharacterized protein n=1 Tax=Crossiella equi TaxID=130796 RepID=A0ABS5A649_9PSEU|nr:hypothetical protein [Crossiella equi]MBP2472065.1 hypothetical protein [Crossiella equi]
MRTRALSLVLTLAAVSLAPVASAAPVEPCSAVAVSPPQVVVDDQTRDLLKLDGWADTSFGVLPEAGGGYRFLSVAALHKAGGADQTIATTWGSLDNPVSDTAPRFQPVANVPANPKYQYAGGGPVFRDPASGLVLQMLHLERNLNESPHAFYTELHLGVYNPATQQTTRLGEIIAPRMDFATADQHNLTADLGTSSFVLRDGYLHAYFPDYSFDGGKWENPPLAVARAPLAEVVEAARRGTVSPWHKFHNGTWTEPAVNGRSTSVRAGVGAWHPSVVRTTRGGTVMVAGNSITEFELSVSPDGMTNWTQATPLFRDPARGNAYPTIVGTGPDPSVVDTEFYLYYLQWAKPGGWDDAVMVRRTVTCTAGRTLPAGHLVGYTNGTAHRTTTTLDRTRGYAPDPTRQWLTEGAPTTGAKALYGCEDNGNQFLSTDPGCEAKTNRVLHTEGWLHTAPAPDRTPLYRCRTGAVRFTTQSDTCDGKGTRETLLGHARTTTLRAYSRFYDGREHWDTSGPVTANYSLEHRWFLESAPKPGTKALYGCAYTSVKGLNHFPSEHANCEGQTVLRTEGWAHTDPRPGTVPLYRCYWPDQDDHFLSPHENCEGVPGGRNEGRLGYALAG